MTMKAACIFYTQLLSKEKRPSSALAEHLSAIDISEKLPENKS